MICSCCVGSRVMVGAVRGRYKPRRLHPSSVASMYDASSLHVDPGAIAKNMATLRRIVGPGVEICCVVKSNAYGLGASYVAPLLAASGASMLAVYDANEAAAMLALGLQVPLLVLAPVRDLPPDHPLQAAIGRGRVHLVVHGLDHLRCVARLADAAAVPLSIHVKIDTGLHRAGCTLDEAPRVLQAALVDCRLRLAGVLTHFADATGDEEVARRQHDLLDAFVAELPRNCLVHEANTVAALRWPWTHRNMVRVGLAWTGCLPPALAEQAGFVPTVSWRARIAHVRPVRAGDRVGYGGHWTAPCDGVVAVVPVGYADGYPIGVGCTGADPLAHVDVLGDDGRAIGAAPVIGVVNMDQFLIDVTDITSRGARVQEGQGVALLSDDPASAASPLRLAQHARCVPHAMLCRVHPDVPRIYPPDARGQVVTSAARCALAG